MTELTQSHLKKILHYNPKTGVFTSLLHRGRTFKGGPVGAVDATTGYVRVFIYGKRYQAHRLAFLYMVGKWPDQIDHANHVRRDNRWSNLTGCDNLANRHNTTLYSNNTSGVLGVHFSANRWRAEINVEGKRVYLGRFKSIDEAAAVRKKADIKYNFHPNHGLKS